MVVLLALTACGTSDEDEIRDVLTGYWSALANGDGKGACERIVEEQRDRLAAAGNSCEEEIVAGGGFFKEDRAAAARRAKAKYDVAVDGDRATATEPGGACAVLVREDDEWRVLDERC